MRRRGARKEIDNFLTDQVRICYGFSEIMRSKTRAFSRSPQSTGEATCHSESGALERRRLGEPHGSGRARARRLETHASSRSRSERVEGSSSSRPARARWTVVFNNPRIKSGDRAGFRYALAALLRQDGLDLQKLRKGGDKPMKSLERVTLCAGRERVAGDDPYTESKSAREETGGLLEAEAQDFFSSFLSNTSMSFGKSDWAFSRR